MSRRAALSVDYPGPGDAEPIKAIQDSWLGERIGSEGFLLNPESLERLREMARSRNILVARQGEEIVSYITFYKRPEWEKLHPGYARGLDYETPELRAGYQEAGYVLIDHIARSRSYSGDAAVRLVARLRRLLRQWGIDHFLGEICPENRRSAAFFTQALGAVRIGSTVRDGNAWDIYAARAGERRAR